MNYKNMEVFENWVKENCKYENIDSEKMEAWVADFEKQIGETGAEHYEMKQFESKSGRPELISFEKYELFKFFDGTEATADDFDTVETAIIF